MMLLSRYPAERYAPPPLGTAPLGMYLGHTSRLECSYKSQMGLCCTKYMLPLRQMDAGLHKAPDWARRTWRWRSRVSSRDGTPDLSRMERVRARTRPI